MRSIRALALAATAGGVSLASLAAFPACSSSSSQGPTSGGSIPTSIPPAGPDVDPPASVVLQPDVVIVHGGASALAAVSSDHGVWTLNKSASGVSQLATGKVVLIAGLDCARVTALQDNGATVDVSVAPVDITDVIQQGSLQWDSSAVDMAHEYIGQIPYGEVVAGNATPDAGAPDGATDGGLMSGLRLQANGPTTGVTIKAGGWSVTFSFSRSGTGLDTDIAATWSPTSSSPAIPGDPSRTLGGINAGVELLTHMTNIQGSAGSVAVNGGTITNANLTSSVEGSVDVDATVSTPHGSQFPQAALLRFPVAYEVPVEAVPGIPLYLSIKSAILIQPSLATANSVLELKGHADLSGNAGATFGKGTGSPTSVPTAMTPADPLGDSNTPPELGTSAMVFALQSPRIGIGVGSMAFGVGAGIFVDAVNSFTLTVASATALVPCKAATWNFASHFGGEMAFPTPIGSINVTHQIDLVPSNATWANETWYQPGIPACKP